MTNQLTLRDGFDIEETKPSNGLINGHILKFKDGGYTVDKTYHPSGGSYLLRNVIFAWVHWDDGKPIEHRITNLNERHPEVDEMPDRDQEEWPAGFNGDLVGYLVYQPTGGGSPITSMLLNRPGQGTGTGAQFYFGYSTSGMNVKLDDSTGLANINTTQSPTSGNTYNSSGGTLNSAFNGLTGNGTWTLFFADMSPGGGTSLLNSFTLQVDAVPEPVTWRRPFLAPSS